jgi:hypothetical protein
LERSIRGIHIFLLSIKGYFDWASPKKCCLGPQNGPASQGPKTREKTAKLENCQNEPVGIGGRPPKSIWINPPPLGSNGLHCIEFPHQMRKFLLNLAPGEPLALVQELPCFDNLIKLDPLLASALDLFVHNMITGCMLYVVGVDLFGVSLFCLSLRCPIMVGNTVEGYPR